MNKYYKFIALLILSSSYMYAQDEYVYIIEKVEYGVSGKMKDVTDKFFNRKTGTLSPYNTWFKDTFGEFAGTDLGYVQLFVNYRTANTTQYDQLKKCLGVDDATIAATAITEPQKFLGPSIKKLREANSKGEGIGGL